MRPQNDKPTVSKIAPTVVQKKLPSPRIRRAINAMMLRYPSAGIKREELDRICGCSNSPDIIKQLREGYVGDEGVICQMVKCIDRDGRHCMAGVYSFSAVGFQRILEQGFHHA